MFNLRNKNEDNELEEKIEKKNSILASNVQENSNELEENDLENLLDFDMADAFGDVVESATSIDENNINVKGKDESELSEFDKSLMVKNFDHEKALEKMHKTADNNDKVKNADISLSI